MRIVSSPAVMLAPRRRASLEAGRQAFFETRVNIRWLDEVHSIEITTKPDERCFTGLISTVDQ